MKNTTSNFNEIVHDIAILAELKLDIIKNGKIRMKVVYDSEIDFEEHFPAEEDECRIKGLETLMFKYLYAWDIETGTLEQQLISITEFEEYILKRYTGQFTKGSEEWFLIKSHLS